MNKKENKNLDVNKISNILTLRYDPKGEPGRKPLESHDFQPKEISNLELKIKEVIKKKLLQDQEKFEFKKLSVSLSAGIDSGLTLATIREYLPDVKISCIGLGFSYEDDEVSRAREIARIYDCDFTELIKNNILNELPKLIGVVKEPRWNLYNYYVFESAKKFSDFCYTGDGGDELFGGYTFRLSKFLRLLPSNSTWKERVKIYIQCHERDWVPDQDKIFGSRMCFSWDKIYEMLKQFFDNNLSPLDQVFLADFNGKLLQEWIPAEKAYEKYLNLNIFSIFLSDECVKLATHIPWQKKYDKNTGLGKLSLRSILLKYKGFENKLLNKKGFGTDLKNLWNKNTKEIVKSYVNLQSEIIKDNIISAEWLKKVEKKIHDPNSELEPRYINKMFLLLALEVWYRIFISKSMKSDQRI